MADDDLVTVANFGSPHEAFVAKGALNAQDIPACVSGAEVATSLWYVGSALGGVKLQVSKRDEGKAAEILGLAQLEERAETIHAWQCPRCHADVDAGFEICWSCGASAAEGTSAASDDAEGANESWTAAASRLIDEDEDLAEPVESEADQMARRAFRAAVFGILFFPLLPYSAYLVVRLIPKELSPTATRHFFGAVSITLLTFVLIWKLFQVTQR